jgi:hypothetical protein
LRRKRKEQKEKINMKVSTKFQINPSTNDLEKCIQSNKGTWPTINLDVPPANYNNQPRD